MSDAIKNPKLMVCVPDGKTVWKKGQLEQGIEEHVAKGPVLHIPREVADYHMERVQVLDPETPRLLQIVFPDLKFEDDRLASDQIREYSPGMNHVAGLIDLSLKLNITHPGITINWQYPEQLLHPANVCALTDCVLKMIDVIDGRNKDKQQTIETKDNE